MMKFVALVGHRHRVDDLAISRGAVLDVNDGERIGLRRVAAEQRGVCDSSGGPSIASFGDG